MNDTLNCYAIASIQFASDGRQAASYLLMQKYLSSRLSPGIPLIHSHNLWPCSLPDHNKLGWWWPSGRCRTARNNVVMWQ